MPVDQYDADLTLAESAGQTLDGGPGGRDHSLECSSGSVETLGPPDMLAGFWRLIERLLDPLTCVIGRPKPAVLERLRSPGD